MLINAPKFFEVAKRIVEITEGAVMVAHNAEFDYRMIRTEFKRLGFEFERQSLCTVDLAQKLIPDLPSYKLGKLVRSLGIPISDAHRAHGDAQATVELFKVLLEKDSRRKSSPPMLKHCPKSRYQVNTSILLKIYPQRLGYIISIMKREKSSISVRAKTSKNAY